MEKFDDILTSMASNLDGHSKLKNNTLVTLWGRHKGATCLLSKQMQKWVPGELVSRGKDERAENEKRSKL